MPESAATLLFGLLFGLVILAALRWDDRAHKKHRARAVAARRALHPPGERPIHLTLSFLELQMLIRALREHPRRAAQQVLLAKLMSQYVEEVNQNVGGIYGPQ